MSNKYLKFESNGWPCGKGDFMILARKSVNWAKGTTG